MTQESEPTILHYIKNDGRGWRPICEQHYQKMLESITSILGGRAIPLEEAKDISMTYAGSEIRCVMGTPEELRLLGIPELTRCLPSRLPA